MQQAFVTEAFRPLIIINVHYTITEGMHWRTDGMKFSPLCGIEDPQWFLSL